MWRGVFAAESDQEKRTLALLKLLTVLKDGETFDSIRRIYPKKPFRAENVYSLASAELLESVSLTQGPGAFLPKHKIRGIGAQSTTKILRVPRQVRDYVSGLIPAEERNQIFNQAIEALFGSKWYDGKVKLRRTLILAYRDTSLASPQNELIVAQYLLQRAIDHGHRKRIDRFARLAVAFCQELLADDRFRDAAIATKAILSNLDGEKHHRHWVNCSFAHAEALRMTGDHEKAASVLQRIIQDGDIATTRFRAEIHLQLAWCNNSLDDEHAALANAAKAIELAHKDTDEFFQASALVAEIKLEGGQLAAALENLYAAARKAKETTAANNIAIKLARVGQSKEASLKYLEEVLKTAKSPYNQTRAIINKADLLSKKGEISKLDENDQIRLFQAYEYSLSQRITHLLDKSHSALWLYCRGKGLIAALFRLFRFSSFVWSLTNRNSKEDEYIRELNENKGDERLKGEDIEVEIQYLEHRTTN